MSSTLAQAQFSRNREAPALTDSPIANAAVRDTSDVLMSLNSSPDGISRTQALWARATSGFNEIASERPPWWYVQLLMAYKTPFNFLLLALAFVSFATNDYKAATVISIMVALSSTLRFWQEFRSGQAAEKMRALVNTTATVCRPKPSVDDEVQASAEQMRPPSPRQEEIPIRDLVRGDVVQLSAGDLIPADVRILSAKDLFVSQATLTGESMPVEKWDAPAAESGRLLASHSSPLDLPNVCFMGTSVVSGTARAVVVATGNKTCLGSLARLLVGRRVLTAFDKGVSGVSWMLIRLMLLMVPLIFLINGFTKSDTFELTDAAVESLGAAGAPEEVLAKLDPLKEMELVRGKFLRRLEATLDAAERLRWQELILNHSKKNHWYLAFLFAVAIAVGLTPEMLPMIVTANLARGAIAMSRRKVIVKKLHAIQNLGAMDVLCTDKTGTLTQDKVVLIRHLDVEGNECEEVLEYTYLNSHFQTGLKNLLDRAVLEHENLVETRELAKRYLKYDEVPFDFHRRRMSVVVHEVFKGRDLLICKGAVEEVLAVCSEVRIDGRVISLTEAVREKISGMRTDLNEDGMRVIAVAVKQVSSHPHKQYGVADEDNLTLIGFVAFLDPPKETAATALAALARHGVAVKILTGDNELVARKVCKDVGLPAPPTLLGRQVEAMSDAELEDAAETTILFAKLTPPQKARIIAALKRRGHTVGFLGDGINDAPALREADAGVSVDSAADIARESADIILLEKSLLVLEEGVVLGRQTYGNTIKYVKMTASSNFGNVFSVLVASVWLPFLPMLAIHLLIQNLLYDISQVGIPFDHMDEDYLEKPRKWQVGDLGRFMLIIGPISSVFDLTTFALMYFVLEANTPEKQALFQSGWFVEGLLSQTLIIHMIRTGKIPFFQSTASPPLLVLTFAVMCVGIAVPFSPLGQLVGLVPLPWSYFPWLLLTLASYCVLMQIVKLAYIRWFKIWL